jgi:16S rRNA pseudouridine516 synthase
MIRLDKLLSDAGVASRRELKAILKTGVVCVNGRPVTDGAAKLDPERDRVTFRGEAVEGPRRVVLMLHKPAGFVTSTEDPRDRTVMELIPERYKRHNVVPVGRLDKETEGLLLFTNDGELAHRLISPKHGVEKRYFARHEGAAGEEDVAAFAAGPELRDGTRCLPAVLRPLGPGESEITVTEGKYHQVRRMMASRGLTVTYLRRDSEGPLSLADLPLGEVRELTAEEIAALDAK